MPTERSVPRPSTPFLCLPHLLRHQAGRIPDAPAILANGRAPLSYARLYQHIEAMGHALRTMGIGRRDRIAVALPNGPELPVAILAVTASAVCAPVNPALAVDELERYFADLGPRAVIAPAGVDSPARRAALSRGIHIIELSIASDAEAGLFSLAGNEGDAPSDVPASPDHIALLLPTSGTTSRPKIVLQRHGGVCASAYAHRAALALQETDRCLNVLPLFHGHGLTGTVVASLAAGASVVCTPGFDVNRFSTWLTAFQPTWYSAVPTMHQAILAQVRHTGERLAQHRLRLVRSSSASLPPSIFAELEQTFDSPVIEWYGMTEVTSSPMACNPLPPRRRKAGSVGVPMALDVAIMDDAGSLVAGGTGEVVVRGASVTTGYDANPQATEAAFAGGWFKTGDLGYFDEDGYLFLVGRSREMINRGGEKIAPQEIDQVLLDHPAVAEVVTFAVPHATLGEDVASAIVLRHDATAAAKDIRQFASGRIAEFKIPRQVYIVRDIPKGPTGKVQRIGLAAKLGLSETQGIPGPAAAPRTPLEKTLAGIWAEVLQCERVGIHDDFFALGGDSLLAMRVLIRLQEVLHVDIDVFRLFDAPTVAEMAGHIETLLQAGHAPRPSAIARVPRTDGTAPVSTGQERLCQLQREVPDLPFFNILYALRLTSPVDAMVLERSINEVVRRHDVLRTTFDVVDGQHVQVIAPQLTVPVDVADLRKARGSRRDTAVEEIIEEALLHSFDLAHGPLIRARLVQLAERQHLLLVSMHQTICDGWSLGVLGEELVTLYDAFLGGRDSPLAPLTIQYADFAAWQRDWRSHPDLVAQLAYWREQLRPPFPVMRLAPAHARRTIDDLRTARREVALPAELSEAAKRFSQQEGGTLFMTLLTAFDALLHRYTGADDLRVASTVANRNHPETERLIGGLANSVILRTSLGGDPTARELFRRVRATCLGAFANHDLPFEEVVHVLENERALDPAALASVMFWLHTPSLRPMANQGRSLAFKEATPSMLLPLVTMTTFDVILMLYESVQGLVGTCVYKPHLFRANTIDRLLRDFQQVIEHIVMQPEGKISAIPLSATERPRSKRRDVRASGR
jgi:acyl-CoA synthetase (AMP-forming)/AMP-acid ligase II